MHPTLMQTYSPLPIELVRGDGVWVWDAAGKRYLDAFAGIAVTNLGHSHPKVVEALINQAKQLIHTSNVLTIPQQNALADKLTSLTAMQTVFFANSGAEANECAIKLARLHGHNQGKEVPTIIVMENAFHGRTLATITASGSRRVQAGFEPLVQGFVRAPFNDLEALRTIANNNHNIVAVFVEPIQGESGIRTPSAGYLKGLRQICDDNQWLMMLDEVQAGVGRTGRWFAHQHEDILPDVMTSAKALANGVPIGACLARGAAAQVLQAGNHGTTYGGNPLACATALQVLQTIEEEHILAHTTTVGTYLKTQLTHALLDLPGVVEVRGQGLMLGIEMEQPCKALQQPAADKGLLFNVAGGNVIRLVPPLILTEEQADQIVETLQAVITEHG